MCVSVAFAPYTRIGFIFVSFEFVGLWSDQQHGKHPSTLNIHNFQNGIHELFAYIYIYMRLSTCLYVCAGVYIYIYRFMGAIGVCKALARPRFNLRLQLAPTNCKQCHSWLEEESQNLPSTTLLSRHPLPMHRFNLKSKRLRFKCTHSSQTAITSPNKLEPTVTK
jgi:hypothetical protein